MSRIPDPLDLLSLGLRLFRGGPPAVGPARRVALRPGLLARDGRGPADDLLQVGVGVEPVEPGEDRTLGTERPGRELLVHPGGPHRHPGGLPSTQHHGSVRVDRSRPALS